MLPAAILVIVVLILAVTSYVIQSARIGNLERDLAELVRKYNFHIEHHARREPHWDFKPSPGPTTSSKTNKPL